jgi:hypothetical protein
LQRLFPVRISEKFWHKRTPTTRTRV